MSNCNFTNNNAASSGTVYLGSSLSNGATISNCNFTDNVATGNGGALYLANNQNTISISGSTFTAIMQVPVVQSILVVLRSQ